MRLAGNLGAGRIQLDKVIPAIKKANEGAKDPMFAIFGGEPLQIPRLVLERLWGFGLETYKKNGIQTNGELIDDDFIRLFVKYRVQVGISIDGPWPLNAARSNKDGTEKTLKAIEKVRAAGIWPALHVILSKYNARGERLAELIKWIKSLEGVITEVRFHLLEVDTYKAHEVSLTSEENQAAYLALSKVETQTVLQPFKDMTKLLQGLPFEKKVTDDPKDTSKDVGCTWNGCDPYTTPAVQGVDGDGTLSNCGRTNKDGVAYRKSSHGGSERVLTLYNTVYEAGGCKGCRYFFACKGQCPGEAIGGDWRNRSTHCRTYFNTFQSIEDRVGTIHPDKIKEYERQVLDGVSAPGSHGDSHGDTDHSDRTFIRVPVVVKK